MSASRYLRNASRPARHSVARNSRPGGRRDHTGVDQGAIYMRVRSSLAERVRERIVTTSPRANASTTWLRVQLPNQGFSPPFAGVYKHWIGL